LHRPLTSEGRCKSALHRPLTSEGRCKSALHRPLTSEGRCKSALHRPLTQGGEERSVRSAVRPVDDVRGRGRDPVVDGRRRLRENGLLLDVGWRRLVPIDGRLRDGLRLSEDGLGLRVDGATADRLHVAELGLSASPWLRDALAHEGALVALGEPIDELPDRVVVAFGVRVLVDPRVSTLLRVRRCAHVAGVIFVELCVILHVLADIVLAPDNGSVGEGVEIAPDIRLLEVSYSSSSDSDESSRSSKPV
jgi:hypothetical protein